MVKCVEKNQINQIAKEGFEKEKKCYNQIVKRKERMG